MKISSSLATILGMVTFMGQGTVSGKDARFRDCGVAADAAESRGVVVAQTRSGRSVVIANALDCSARAYVLVTDIDSGETHIVYAPAGVSMSAGGFGSLLSENGCFYTGRGRELLEFDPDALEWTWHGVPSPGANHTMSFAEEAGGTRIWAAVYPTCALVRFDPDGKVAREVARLDKEEKYPQSLAVDSAGWVYAGIGTARCNLVAYGPATGEVRSLIPSEERAHGTGQVYPCTDGSVMGVANGKSYRLFEGKTRPYAEGEKRPSRRPTGFVYYGRLLRTFPDGRVLTRYDLPGRTMTVKDPGTGAEREIELAYRGGGAQVTSLATGPEGMVYASTCHPMHLARLDPVSGAASDLGGIPAVGGGNFCAMTSCSSFVYGAEYAGGRLWRYDPSSPWSPGKSELEILGVHPRSITETGSVEKGHFTYLADRTVALLRGDSFGARGDVPLTVPQAGRLYVCVQPFDYPGYTRMKFLIDGEPAGPVVDPGGGRECVGDVVALGPFDWEAGTHTLSIILVETEGRNTWASVVSIAVVSEPVETLVRERRGNPLELAQWKRDICRPRTILAHPDGRHVLISGFAGYGLCGGGIGIFDTEAGVASLLTAEADLLSGHSCITLKALPSGDLVGGTSVNAPGGGHPTASEAELFVLDWERRRIRSRFVPLPGVRQIISIHVSPSGLVFGLAEDSTFFVVDPSSERVLHSESLKAYGGVPRHALQAAGQGRLYAMMKRAILRIDQKTYTYEVVARPPNPVSAGGAFRRGFLCYSSVANLWTFHVGDADGE